MKNPFPAPITPTWLIHNILTPHQRDFAANAINQHDKLAGLWAHVETFIAEQEISCPESVSQCDRIILNAYTFIEGCCDIVGYRANDPAWKPEEES